MNFPFLLIGSLALAGAAFAQTSVLHTFTPPPSGSDIRWPAQVLDTETLSYGEPLPSFGIYEGSLRIFNSLNNTLFIDESYLATGNAPNISDNAMWGNPRSGPPLGDAEMEFDFVDFFSGDENGNLVSQVKRVSFDFAWATSDFLKVLDTLRLEVTDRDGNTVSVEIPFDQTFFHNLAPGAALPTGFYGQVVLEAGENVPLENIHRIRFVNLDDTNPGGQQGEFAIDNLTISGPAGIPSELGPVGSDGGPLFGYSTNSLKGNGIFSISDRMYNGGGESTTFSVNWTSSSPLIYQPQPFENVPIGPDEFVDGAFTWEIDTDTAPSGRYTGEFTFIDDNNPADSDNTLTLVYYDLFDPPILSDNAGSLVIPGGQATLSNAAAGGHPGALRASAKINQLVRTNPRFTVSGMAAANVVDFNVTNPAQSIVMPGQTLTGNIAFNAAGAASGTHTGLLRLVLEMTSGEDYYLNDREPLDDLVWSLSYTVAPKPMATPTVATGDKLDEIGADISGEETGAALIGGTSSSDQLISLSFVPSPPVSNPAGYGTAVGLDFGTTEELFVLQLSYQDLPAGFSESGLRIQALNGASWVSAISLNGNGGATVPGAAPYLGSYSGYLSQLGGNVLDAADLGAFGVDASTNTAWIVLDYEGTFQLATGAVTSPPKILGFTYDAGSNTSTITYQSALVVSFGVSGGSEPGALDPIGTTAVGTGGIMEYLHLPEGAPSRFFYRLSGP